VLVGEEHQQGRGPDGTMTDVIQCSECLNIFSGMRVTSQ
jgi:hypothetical protein